MKANHELPRDDSDDALDRAILAAKSQPYPPEVKNRAIEKATTFTSSRLARNRFMGRWTWRILASAIPAIAAACMLVFLLLPSTSVGWEDVVKTVKSQKWIRVNYSVPKSKQVVMWLSPERQVWALQTDDQFVYFDGRRQEKYEYRTGQKQIVKMLLSQEDAQRILPVDYMAQGSWLFGNEKLLSKRKREVTEDGKTWIDFEIAFHRGADNLGTLRVDPDTRLPVYMTLTYSKDVAKSIKCTFDYPADGPTDIYALGVPAKIKIDNRMPPEDCLQVIRAMAASRERIGDFRLVVAMDPPNHGVSSIVWRKGDRWRIDTCQSEQMLPPKMWGAKPPDGLGWDDPIAEYLKLSWVSPNLICDGRMVYQNEGPDISWLNNPQAKGPPTVTWKEVPFTTSQELMSGEGFGDMPLAPYTKIASMVYPDLIPVINMGFEFDPRPADAPGCVLIKSSVLLTDGTLAHIHYYIDPVKGCAVVRKEVFALPPNAPENPSTAVDWDSYRMEDFIQSPQGFWYPKSIHYKKTGSGVRSIEDTVHYHFDFDIALPDSLFVVDHASEPKK
jgi:hypothetical protein